VSDFATYVTVTINTHDGRVFAACNPVSDLCGLGATIERTTNEVLQTLMDRGLA